MAARGNGDNIKSEVFIYALLSTSLLLVAYTQWQLYVDTFHWYEGVATMWPVTSFKGPRLSIAGAC
jgi:hypothetical protein